MPLYDFKCSCCNNIMTKLNTIENRDDNTENCPDCNSKSYVRIVSPVQIVSGVSGQTKHSDWFKDKVQEIKKHVGHTGSDQFNSIV